jgi:hypothetical protein
MKKSLLKSLALVGLVLSFASCESPDGSSSSSTVAPVELTIGQATEWDNETLKTVNDGTLVTIKDAAVTNIYEGRLIVQQTEGTTLDGIHAVEIIRAEGDDTAFGWKDAVNVTGIVGDIDGRPVIKDAVVEWAVDETTSKGTAEVYGYGALTRSGFDQLAGRGTSGMLAWNDESPMQLATLPGTVVAGTPSEFKLVFPGEKLEATNPIAIPVVIPALSETHAALVNKMFEDVDTATPGKQAAQVGDAFLPCLNFYWVEDTVGLILTGIGAQISGGWAPVTNVHADWSEVPELSQIDPDLLALMPDLGKTGTSIYNYVSDPSTIAVDENGLINYITVVAYTDDADADYEILKGRIAADTKLNWTLLGEAEGQIVFDAYSVPADSSSEAEFLAEIVIENMISYLNIYIVAKAAATAA